MIKVLSWNVEHFKSGKADKVVEIIKAENPDIFAVYEVEDQMIYDVMLKDFPDFTSFLTVGQQSQHILVACKNKFSGIKFQQKEEFKSGNPKLRPGVFLTFMSDAGGMYGFLFLHTDSGTTAVDFGNRNEMFEHAINLKRKIDSSTGDSNFIITGDLNTMGLNYPKSSNNVLSTISELDFINIESAKKIKSKTAMLKILTKPAGTEYSKNFGVSDLDHVIASEHLKFNEQIDPVDNNKYEVKLGGWREYKNDPVKMNKFTEEVSDHCPLIFEIVEE